MLLNPCGLALGAETSGRQIFLAECFVGSTVGDAHQPPRLLIEHDSCEQCLGPEPAWQQLCKLRKLLGRQDRQMQGRSSLLLKLVGMVILVILLVEGWVSV